MKPYYIIPTAPITKHYYDVIHAESAQEAMTHFVKDIYLAASAYFNDPDKVHPDMSSCFAVTDEKPLEYPHGYDIPNGYFEESMTLSAKAVHESGALLHNNPNIAQGLSLLQMSYDMITKQLGYNPRMDKSFYDIILSVISISHPNDNTVSQKGG